MLEIVRYFRILKLDVHKVNIESEISISGAGGDKNITHVRQEAKAARRHVLPEFLRGRQEYIISLALFKRVLGMDVLDFLEDTKSNKCVAPKGFY